MTLFTITFNSTTNAGFTNIILQSTALVDPIGNDIAVVTAGATYGNPVAVPVAIFTQSPTTVFVKEPIVFNASQSYDPSGGKITLYLWETDALTGIFESLPTSTSPILTFIFPSSGIFTMGLIVFNDNGARSHLTLKTVDAQEKIIIPIAPLTCSLDTSRRMFSRSSQTLRWRVREPSQVPSALRPFPHPRPLAST